MMNGLYYKFEVDDKQILVEVPKLTEQRKQENIMIYGTKYGVHKIIVVNKSDKTLYTTNEVIEIGEQYD